MSITDPLSKSLFVAGVQCVKQLWWRVHEPLADELQPDIVLQDRFDQGRQVGELARATFPEGVLVTSRGERDERLHTTASLLAAGAQLLFEPSFQADGVFVSIDVLQRDATACSLIEVKSASSQKVEHIPDAAVQAHVLAANGIDVQRVEIMHLNGDFVHPDVGDLFVRTDITEQVRGRLSMIPGDIERQLDALAGPLPDIGIGMHCFEPRACPFLERCWPNDPNHIKKLYLVGPKKAASYLQSGIDTIDKLPKDAKLSPVAQRQRRALASNALIVEPTLAKALEPFNVQPLGFLDFETVSRAVPVWNGMSPWGQAPAQLSYHQSLPDGTYRHDEHLAEGADDARPLLAHKLVELTKDAAKVVTYSPFEKTQIRGLQKTVPELAQPLRELEEKLIDLHPVVRENVYHPGFMGSFSIKYVLTPLVPDLTYHDLVVVNGLMASVQIARLLFVADRIAPDERPRVRTELLEYCKRDTWAMVRLLQRLRDLSHA
jgi:predicted RecB family nuclease